MSGNNLNFENTSILYDNNGVAISIDNPLSVEIPPLISVVNSTITPLGIGGVFTGTYERTNGFGIAYVNVFTDQISAVDGLLICQSSDGINDDHCEPYSIPASNGKNFSFNLHSKYFKIIYTNGAVEQTIFRLQTIFKETGKPSSHRVQESIVSDDDAELVKAVITGKSPSGIFKNANVTEDGNLAISDNSSGLSIAKGEVTGHTGLQKFGNAPDFDTADGFVTVWDGADDGAAWEQMLYQYSTTADIDSISSSSDSDTVDMTIIGLDENYDLVEQTITLTGRTRAALTTNLIRVFRGYNDNSVDLVGHVAVYVNTALTTGIPTDTTKIRAIIDPANQQTKMCLYTIPAGKTGYLLRGYAATGGASKSSQYILRFFAREFGKVFRLQHINSISDTGSSSLIVPYYVPLSISEKTDLELRVSSTAVGASGCSISGGFDLVLVDN